MSLSDSTRIGYVMKMYPRFSETFILNEILAHEAAGHRLSLYSLRPPADGRFHAALADVRAPVTYLPSDQPKSATLWAMLADARRHVPAVWDHLDDLVELEPRDAMQALLLARAVVEDGLTHLHAHFASVATTVARLAARMAGVSYSFTAHAKDIFHESVDDGDIAAKMADAAAIVTVSDFNLAHLRSRFPQAAERLYRIYNGLDLIRFPFASPLARPPRIIAVGRLVEKKGFADLVAACAVLAHRGVEFACEIIGAGPEEARLRQLVAHPDLRQRVLLPGPLPQSAIIARVQQAAVLAAPCVIGRDGNRDGLPTVILEAMALGTPVVATDVTGIPEVLHDGRTGLLAPQGDPVALANALQRLLANPDLRERLAGSARDQIERSFDAREQVTALHALFTNAPVGSGRPLQGVPA